MPLNWHFTPGKHFAPEMVDEDGSLKERFGVLILFTQKVGIDRITEENVTEFARRVAEFERIIGYSWANDKGPVPFTLDDCAKLIGLRTNATGIKKMAFDEWMAREDAANKKYREGREGRECAE